jgi:hypothetical protein
MNDGQLSSMTKAMIEAAKADVPSAAARAKVWTQVSGAVGAAAAGGGAAAASAAGMGGAGVGAAKLLAVGALFGGTLTVGLAVAVLRVGTVPERQVAPAAVAMTLAQAKPKAAMPGANVVPEIATPHAAAGATSTPSATLTSIPIATPSRSAIPRAKAVLDPLAREAQLVSEARGALGRGDPQRALQAVRAARALPSHQLAPEELAVEAQALRALGRPGDANEVDETLRSQFPESALAR